jgi:hypothetical protein
LINFRPAPELVFDFCLPAILKELHWFLYPDTLDCWQIEGSGEEEVDYSTSSFIYLNRGMATFICCSGAKGKRLWKVV